MAERRTRKGRSFYGCSNYPDCTFSTWYRPGPVVCPTCGFIGAEQRSTKARGEYREAEAILQRALERGGSLDEAIRVDLVRLSNLL